MRKFDPDCGVAGGGTAHTAAQCKPDRREEEIGGRLTLHRWWN
jgi:hypothetical protein